MKKWPWRTILAITACSLICIGMLPFGWCLWDAYGPRPRPFFMALPPKAGTYISMPFPDGFSGPYRVDLERHSAASQDETTWLDLDWKIVDDRRGIVRQGAFHSWTLGDSVGLGGFPDGFRKGQRIIVTLPHDLQGIGPSMRLKLGVDADEIGLDLSYAWGLVVGWAVLVAGPGVLILVFLSVQRLRANRALSITR